MEYQGFLEPTGRSRYVLKNKIDVNGKVEQEKILQQQFRRIVYSKGIVCSVAMFWEDVPTYTEDQIEKENKH